MRLSEIPELFGTGKICGLSELGEGHINRTFLAQSESGRLYILQSLNRSVFGSPETVMRNIALTEQALQGHCEVKVPHFLMCGEKNHAEVSGETWRVYEYSESTGECDAYSAGFSFGAFIRIMSGSGADIRPVTEHFHDFEHYYSQMLKTCPAEVIPYELTELREQLFGCFSGLPVRIIHGDAKTGNIIAGQPCTIIDLDTVMKGYAALDYGDMVRSVCSAGIGSESIASLTKGFTDALAGLLTEAERASLYSGVLYVTGELAMRYLTDVYVQERYFKGKTREQCAERTKELLEQLREFKADEKEFFGKELGF